MQSKTSQEKGGNKQSDDAFVCCDDIQLCFNFVFWQRAIAGNKSSRFYFQKWQFRLLTKHGWASCGNRAELKNFKFFENFKVAKNYWPSKIGLGRRTWPKSISRWRLQTRNEKVDTHSYADQDGHVTFKISFLVQRKFNFANFSILFCSAGRFLHQKYQNGKFSGQISGLKPK